MADNFHVEVISTLNYLDKALALIETQRSKIYGYQSVFDKELNIYRLIFYWTKPESNSDVIPFPATMPIMDLIPIIVSWIGMYADNSQNKPDIDGIIQPGFYLSTGKIWNFVEDFGHYSAFEIRPHWIMIGK